MSNANSRYRLHPILLAFAITVLCCHFSLAENPPIHDHEDGESIPLEFVPNLNQYHPKANYSIGLGNMDKLFLTDKGFTYIFHNHDQVEELHDVLLRKDSVEMKNHVISGHVYNIDFLGADFSNSQGHDAQKHKYNFFKGNDPSGWASNVPAYHETEFTEIYQHIDMKVYSHDGLPKYDFIIRPGGDPSIIQSRYVGTDKLHLNEGNLIIETSVNRITEAAPIAYQIINGVKINIECQYILNRNILSYSFPKGYDTNETLVIDPTVIGATVSGFSGYQLFGHTSCFDNSGNIYNGGTAFDTGLTTTTGAFQSNFADEEANSTTLTDMAFHKYNSDASELIYGTYIGGRGNDFPHSTIVDDYGQLCILGSTESINFPTSTNAYQSDYGGGDYDIVLVKLSEDGSSLIGSTYLGGNESDGINLAKQESGYGEDFRGEIILDNQGDIYITSVSSSADFPITANVYQPNLNTQTTTISKLQDAVVLKINSDLSTLFWSTFLGGNNADTGFGIRIADDGGVYVTGIAGNANFADIDDTWPGGTQSAYVVKLSPNGQNILKSRFYGTSGEDHSYFIDIDELDNVHIYGRTNGQIQPTPNTFTAGSNSRQFLAAFDEDLEEIIYQTTIGNNNSFEYNLIPSAFMVDKCNSIYFSGYRATDDMPTTSDAIQSEIDNGAFYLGVLTENAEELSFGTYYGEADHVDGGTSRFDKGGIVYQGVCSCTDQDRALITTSNAFSQTQTARCDMGMFKIDFDIATVTAKAAVAPSASGCAPFDADFRYTGQDGEEFFWDFGDGSSTTDENPSHTFLQSGEYTVTLIATAGGTCNVSDTATLSIFVLNEGSTSRDTSFCEDDAFLFLDATIPNGSFIWQDGSSTSTYVVEEPGTYWVDIFTSGCSQRDSFIVSAPVDLFELNLGEDQQLCDISQYSLQIEAPEGINYEWSNGEESNEITITESGNYSVTTTNSAGCVKIDDVDIIIGTTPIINFGSDTTVCQGESITLIGPSDPNIIYSWQDGSDGNIFVASTPGVFSLTAENNGCFATEEFILAYAVTPTVEFDIDNVLCYEDCNGIIAINSQNPSEVSYQWQAGIDLNELCAGTYEVTLTDQYNCKYLTDVDVESPIAISPTVTFDDVSCPEAEDGMIEITANGGTGPFEYEITNVETGNIAAQSALSGGTYSWLLSDANGCTTSGIVDIYESPIIEIYAGTDTTIDLGTSTLFDSWILPLENQSISWDQWDFLDCNSCETPTASPYNTTIFEMTVTDQNTGCEIKDQIEVRVQKDRKSFIPNVITPNDDGQNDWASIFGNIGIRQIRTFKIFDRWGELIFIKGNFQPNDHQLGWDGKFNGQDVVPGVYVYLAEVEYLDDYIEVLSGDITVLR